MNLKLECQGKEMVLAPGNTYIVGRGAACDFVVVSDRVSRRQLELGYDGSSWVITDLDSANGTFVGGTAVKSCTVSGTLNLVVGGRRGIELRVSLVPATAVAPVPVP
ncbi:MAG: FHA domain-containing protein, partial [Nitrosospira sp.]|nr:FHA domain-containing protein [Nitrosospira sp.]